MEGIKMKIDINDLRTDKGGDPDKYRQALSLYHTQQSEREAHAHRLTNAISFAQSTPSEVAASIESHDSNNSNNTNNTNLIDQVLHLETHRRQTTTQLENLRAQSSTYQKTVIFPKKTANQDISVEVAQFKQWKVEIAALSKEVKDVEKQRGLVLQKINQILEKLQREGGQAVENQESKNEGIDNGDGSTKDDDNGKVNNASCSDKDSNSDTSKSLANESNGDTSIPPIKGAAEEGQNEIQQNNTIQQSPAPKPAPTEKTTDTTTTTPTPQTSTLSSSSSLPLLSAEQIKSIPPERILNLNVGVLGHVDTGKTSLVKTLSSVLSTASLDKSKQSRARGITLDLGFSAFLLPLPEHLRGEGVVGGSTVDCGGSNSKTTDADDNDNADDDDNDTTNNNTNSSNEKDDKVMNLQQKYDLLQVTLVDCPGHASLIRTIIGGAQIIDMVLLVVDATKGMQTQTAECLVIAEMTTRNLIVVLNKVDMFPEHEREEKLRLAEKKMRMALRGTKFEDATMVGISACVGGEKVAAVGGEVGEKGMVTIGNTYNIHGLLDSLQSQLRAPSRDTKPSPDRFHFAVDHCFPIKGQGTVLTGTCLSGSARPNDMVEFPTLATQKKIKGLQMFRRKANIIQQGDRAGICVSNFDAKLMERGIVASPGTVKLIRGAIAVVRKVRFFKGGLHSGAKFHVSVGHTTVMATVTFWGAREIAMQVERNETEEETNNDVGRSSSKGKNVKGTPHLGKSSLGGSADLAGLPRLKFDWNQDFLHQDNYLDVLPTNDSNNEWSSSSSPSPNSDKKSNAQGGKRINQSNDASIPPLHWARLEFHTPVYCPMDSLVIGSRLDTDVNANACRLAFSGRLVERYDAKTDHGRLKTYTKKEKIGTVCRLGDPFRRNDDNKVVRYEVFGTDLFKKETNMSQFVGLLIETERGEVGSIQSSFGTSGKFRVNFPGGAELREGDALYLRFKRYANDPRKAIHQDGTLPRARTGSRIDPPVKKKKNKGKNGVSDGSNPDKATNADSGENDTNTSVVSGEIVKLKGDLLDNGKHTIAIVSGFFSMEDDISKHKGRKVVSVTTAEEGLVDSSFGKAGKCKVVFDNGISGDVGSRVQMQT